MPFSSLHRAAPSPAERQRLQGVLDRVVFSKEETSFHILHLMADDAAGRRKVSVLGTFPAPQPGVTYEFQGAWEDGNYGPQFRAASCTEIRPSTLLGLERYLAEGPFPHIGIVRAGVMTKKWGMGTLTILDSQDAVSQLTTLSGITTERAQAIKTEWDAHRKEVANNVNLYQYGLTAWQVGKLLHAYKDKAHETLKENPYQVIGVIPRFGFKTVDSIAQRLGVPLDDIRRARAAFHYLLDELATNEGHTWVDRAWIAENANKVGLTTERLLEGAASLRETTTLLAGDDERFALAALWNAEERVAERLRGLLDGGAGSEDGGDGGAAGSDGADSLPDGGSGNRIARVHYARGKSGEKFPTSLGRNSPVQNSPLAGKSGEKFLTTENNSSGSLTPEQLAAADLVGQHRVVVVTGGPGVGKTFLLQVLRSRWDAAGKSVAYCAPTGKAAMRMSEILSSGGYRIAASTIHRLLAYNPEEGFGFNESNRLLYDVVVMDESSMTDIPLMDALTAALPDHARLVLVGDADQLPSVGSGAVLRDTIASGAVPTARLTKIMRQAEGSAIVQAAHAVLRGHWLTVDNERDDLKWYCYPDDVKPEVIAEELRRFIQGLPRDEYDPIRDVQVLCPMKRGPIGTFALNEALQNLLNPATPGKPVLTAGWRKSKQAGGGAGKTGGDEEVERVFRMGDKVIQTRNSYDLGVFNGETGIVTGIQEKPWTLVVDFGAGRNVVYDRGAASDLQLAYALTIHKFQGSQIPLVVVPLHTTNAIMLRRQLLYTAITRAQQCCVLLGTDKALKMAIRNDREAVRNTRLRELLKGGGR